MRTITVAQARGLVDAHTASVDIDVVDRSGAVLIDGLAVGDNISLTLDATAAVRRHVQFDVLDPEPFYSPPQSGAVVLRGSDVDPSLVNLLKVTAGFNGIGGSASYQVGLFVVAEPTLHDPGLSLTLQGYDLSALVSAYPLVDDYAPSAGTNVADAIADLIDFVVPAPVLSKSFAATSAVIPAGTVLKVGADAMAEAMTWAASAGMDLFFDATGTLVLRAVPDPFSAPSVWTYASGVDAIMTDVEQVLSVQDSFSHVAAIGQLPDGTPVRADSYDTDPASPTYYLGPFGDRLAPVLSGTFDSPTTAQTAADAELLRKKGTTQVVTLQGVPVTAHDEQDIVTITRAVSGLSAAKFMIEQATLPLGYTGKSSVRFTGRVFS